MQPKLSLFFILFLLLPITIQHIPSASEPIMQLSNVSFFNTIIYVDDDNTEGPYDGTIDHPYRHIQDAVNNASNGDIIYIFNGIYNESIVISKTLSLYGENQSATIIDGRYQNYGFTVLTDYVTITNITIRNTGGFYGNAGIIINANNTSICNCTFYRTRSGIIVNKTIKNTIRDCIFHTNGGGIALNKAVSTFIKNCCFCYNGIGIEAAEATATLVQECYATTNGIGYFFLDSINSFIDSCAAYDNNDNQGGFFLQNCSSICINNSIIRHNGFGIKIVHCTAITISNSSLSLNTHAAIYINHQSKNIQVCSCEITNNLRFSINSENSHSIFSNNNIYASLFGLYLNHASCNAQKNWWGSVLGPALLEYPIRDRVRCKSGVLKVFPWLLIKQKNTGATWEINENRCNIPRSTSRYTPIMFNEKDSDEDGVPDWWEKKWGYSPDKWDDHRNLDPDHDGLTNIEECFTDRWGSNPFQKDIFLEFDWMESPSEGNNGNKPSQKCVNEMITVFARHNITLHVDLGELGGGEQIPYHSNFSYAELRDFYWDFFLHNDLNNPRKGIFHYCLICDIGPGPGFAFIGWDNLDSFDISAEMLQQNQPLYSREHLIIHGVLHELGHTLGLTVDDHGGNDNEIATWPWTIQHWKYRSYKSVMNYWYTYKIFDYSDGSHGKNDFDDWGHLDFSFFKNTHFRIPSNKN